MTVNSCSYYAIVSPTTSLPCSGAQPRTSSVIVGTWLVPLVVASPYLYSGTYPFTIGSHLGTVSRLICADRFDDIDGGGGQFRRSFFLFLFVVVYALPLALICGTCARTAAVLRRHSTTPLTPYNTAVVVHKREQNRRKVRDISFTLITA